MKKTRKWLSILLTVSLIAAMVIIPTTVSAENSAVAYKSLIYSQNFNDADKVKLSDNWGKGITETEVWCGYNSALKLEARSEETPEDLCLVRPDGTGTVYTIFTLPFDLSDTDDTTYEITFDYYAMGDELCYLENQPYVRLQTVDVLAPAQWHKIKMVVNVKEQIFTVNGVEYDPAGSFKSSYKYIQFAQGNANTHIDAKFDNFKIYKRLTKATGVNASITNGIGEDVSLQLIFAGYNEVGQGEGAFELQAVEFTPIEVSASEASKSVNADIPQGFDDYDYVRVFLWEFDTLVPITESLQIK